MGTMKAVSFPALEATVERLNELLERARQFKSVGIEPPLSAAEYAGNNGLTGDEPNHSALIEAAARRILQAVLASSNVGDSGFVDVWNLLDILSLGGNEGQCDAALAWSLIEELLDSQSIDGCRVVFRYLESRRERLTSKDFGKKSLIILRTFNELLRRLSRAEDTVFCGQVYIFLFQSFPLGDRSSVNLRGDFHIENVTTFEDPVPTPTEAEAEAGVAIETDALAKDVPMADAAGRTTTTEGVSVTISAPDDKAPEATSESESRMTIDELYPIFWTLQKAFSDPPTVFKAQYLDKFKTGLEATLDTFKRVPTVIQAAATQEKRGVKRNADEAIDDFASTYNPKYLTSRELFSLELSDLAFQRHILVQALILIDFLLSLTDKARTRLAHITSQKALQYNFTLSETDADWAYKMRDTIKEHLQNGESGKFYYRMVETVLSRDKNWVRWKLESCPPIAKPPVDVEEYISAKGGARIACSSKRLRSAPMGSLNLTFLADAENHISLQGLRRSDRYNVPTAEALLKGIESDTLDIDFATTDEEKARLREVKQNKTWRLLRMMTRTKLGMFNTVEDGQKLDIFFKDAYAVQDVEKIYDGMDSDAKASDGEQFTVDGPQQKQTAEPMLDVEARAAPVA